ncbi:heme-degrading domain-containing protein [Paucilactobacillus suebicus]|uniref:Uncharacterized protein n=1 Tax=Paucilactobacillus suebicus DSM 5007 = KCTC 3549 TaxID=1423807 RepID=A0A0R1W4U0_9LACO|nr:heme-degrading domain-containing protein [Paucilactobacillus suebicus]KRM12808.1 hypothetical protein FD16_GL001986 [Paucilactobacillus suebicus DSM 5007 = KCTC 3549]
MKEGTIMIMPTSQEVEQEEKELQFTKFDNDTALQLGYRLVEMAKAKSAPVTIDITRTRQQLFHAALPGTAIDNDKWLQRKINTVYNFGTSSLAQQLKMEAENRGLDDASLLDKTKYAAAGGAFPVVIKGTGLIGTIAVSGMQSEEDHQLIVDCLKEFLQ